jgi:hypothetical protein
VQQGYIAGMFPVGEPDDPGESVVGPVLVEEPVALETERPETAAGEMVKRGAAHPAQSDHDHIVGAQKPACACSKVPVRAPVLMFPLYTSSSPTPARSVSFALD